jgi:AmmeMemoRadiSam system protein B
MDDKPRLRAIEAFPVQQNGKTLIYLKDPLNFAIPLGISQVGYFILSHFDGRHSLIDIQEAYCKRFGTLLLSEELKDFIDTLDQHYYLQSERFGGYRDTVLREFHRLGTSQLEGYFSLPNGPGLPSPQNICSTPRAVVAPHIDFHRGGAGYAWAYKPLAESDGADLYILLGTSHCGGQTPYILTLKDFATPLGDVETDKDFVNRLAAQSAEDYFVDEYLHRGEHSLEFQVVFLKYVAQRRAALTGQPERPFKIVPILVSSFHSMVVNQTAPEKTSGVGAFLHALRESAEKETRQVCFVAGVDLAHVGPQFGDREPITDDFLKRVETEDHELVDRLLALDAPGFFNHIAKDQDRRRICGFSPLYSLIHILDGVAGKHLKYSQAFTPETGSAVSFTSLIFE